MRGDMERLGVNDTLAKPLERILVRPICPADSPNNHAVRGLLDLAIARLLEQEHLVIQQKPSN